MPHAVFHIIFAMLVAGVVREYVVKDKKKFPIHYVFIAGLAGIFPDLDVAAFWILYFFGFSIEEVHRTFSHTLFFPLTFLLLALIFSNYKNKEIGRKHMKLSMIFLMISLGLFIHLFLDSIVAGMIRPFYPLHNFSVGLNLISYLPYPLRQISLPSFDAGIFILWLIWLEWKHKISNFF